MPRCFTVRTTVSISETDMHQGLIAWFGAPSDGCTFEVVKSEEPKTCQPKFGCVKMEKAPDEELAIARYGFDARPTGRLRFIAREGSGRFQSLWRGSCGEGWIDVPVVNLHVMPPHDFPDVKL